MRERDSVTLLVLRAIKTAITNQEKLDCVEELDDLKVVGIIRKQIKQRQDSMEQFDSAGRVELASKEAMEKLILEEYLPKQLSQEELDSIICSVITKHQATSRKQMGAVMKDVNAEIAGRADGKTVSKLVIEKLS